MPQPNIQNERTSMSFATKIRSEIIPALDIGDKLPTERALSEKYNVSRTIIREALMILEIHGIIETKRGSGSILLQKNPEEIFTTEQIMEIGPFELIQARLILECAVVRFAARVATPTDIRELSQLLKSHEYYLHTDFNLDKINKYDTDFHIRIAEATHNMALIQSISTVRKYSGHSESWQIFKQFFESDKSQLELSLQEHTAILNGIANRDPEGASKAMYGHIHRKVGTLKEECKKQKIQMDNVLFDFPSDP